MKKTFLPVALLAGSLLYSACKKDDNQLNIPTTYDASKYTANTAVETSLRTAMSDLAAEMKNGRTPGVPVNYATLSFLFKNGSPALATTATPYYNERVEYVGGWLEQLSKASGNTYVPGAPQGEGGVFGGYLFDEYGLDLGEVVDKGLYAAALYNHAIKRMQAVQIPEQADQLLCIFGAHPDFPNTDNATNTANPDRFMAQYAARRDKNDGKGFYTQMKNAFLKLQAANKAGDAYQAEQQEALQTIQQTWEKINFATVINYCHTTISKLSATNPTDADIAAGLHAYSEAVGFVHGWRTLPQAYRTITDAQIDEVLVLLNAPYDANPTTYLFLTDPVNELPKLTQVIAKLKTIYGFTNQEIEDFKANWVAKQGR